MQIKKSVLPVVAITLLFSCAKQVPPTVSLNGEENTYILLGETYQEEGATATDYRGRDISDRIEVLGSVDDGAGSYQLDYLATDKRGNTSVATRNVVRGYRNSDLAGTYDVIHNTNNGGGSHTFTGTVSAESGNNISFTIDNTNCPTAPIVLDANMNSGAIQFDIPDQTANGHTITNGQFNNISGGTADNAVLSISFQAFNGWITYNHTATWTKQ